MSVWYPVIELTCEDPYEKAENISGNFDGTEARVASVERDNAVYIERSFDDGEGWREIGIELTDNPNLEMSIDAIGEHYEEGATPELRMVFDYTNEQLSLEERVEEE